jgi:AcrR family transcriptional regulator
VAEDERRVRRTRRALRDALIGLILEKGYERITVQQILDRADVVRSTFYAHYRDKESLLLSCFDDLLAELGRMLAQAEPGAPLSDPARPAFLLYQQAGGNPRVFRALCGREGGQQVNRQLHRLISELLCEHLRPQLAAADSDLPADLVADYYVDAMLGLMGWWIEHGFPHDAAWLARAFETLAVPGLLTALGRHPRAASSLPA